ncbi:UNVERIFIED_CONTAM: hypothetical protein BEN50_03275 [Euhalothece sp. KZN 001]
MNSEPHEEVVKLPVAIGRTKEAFPPQINDREVAPIELREESISRFHLSIFLKAGELVVADHSKHGTYLNNKLLHHAERSLSVEVEHKLQLGSYEISLIKVAPPSSTETPASDAIPRTKRKDQDTTIDFDLKSGDVLASLREQLRLQDEESFPSRQFDRDEYVSVSELHKTGLQVEEAEYAALGGGLGSFTWVDTLRISGVSATKIRVLGADPSKKPYGRYLRLCRNSQIPPHERLRSGSDSTPDNIWAWPGYAWREAWQELKKGHFNNTMRLLWQVFSEPILANTYTPKSGNVFASIDREATRIDWEAMFQSGRILKIRKTGDGRYAIAYSRPSDQHQENRFLVARYVQLALGYPAIKFLPDLLKYREKTNDFKSVVNAYEDHEHVYKQLKQGKRTVVLRGRGIVASRILQRLYEVRQQNPNITVIHLMRSPKPEGNKSGRAQRPVENHWEFQPYNWPKSTWGGTAKMQLENASPEARRQLLSEWGGTTTADRDDWRQIVKQGLGKGWYQITFGSVMSVEPNEEGRLVTRLAARDITGDWKVVSDYIIDCTGLDAKPSTTALLEDLIEHYELPLNVSDRLEVNQRFELEKMRNGGGRMYAAGIQTLGGPYAPVDTFLGLQYAARQSVDDLARLRAPQVKYLNGFNSFLQWLKWVNNQEP